MDEFNINEARNVSNINYDQHCNISTSRTWTVGKEIFYYSCWSLVSNYESHNFSKLDKLLREHDQISLECQQQSNILIYNVKVATKICTLSSELYLCNKVYKHQKIAFHCFTYLHFTLIST